MTMTPSRLRRPPVQCAEIDDPECARWIVDEARRRHAAGDRRAARHVALDVLEDVWLRTRSRPKANAAYKQALTLARHSLR